MYTSPEDDLIIDKELWRTWAFRDKRREQATARRSRLIAGLVLVMLALVGVFYYLRVIG